MEKKNEELMEEIIEEYIDFIDEEFERHIVTLIESGRLR